MLIKKRKDIECRKEEKKSHPWGPENHPGHPTRLHPIKPIHFTKYYLNGVTL